MGIISPQMVVYAILATLVTGYVLHCEYVKKDRASFIAKLEAQAEEQKRKNKEQELKDKKAKETADAEAKTLRADNAALARKLRQQRSSSRFVPPAPTGTKSPDRIAFDRTLIERALQQLDDEVSGIIAEGDQARIGLDTAKKWSNSVLRLRLSERLTLPSLKPLARSETSKVESIQ